VYIHLGDEVVIQTKYVVAILDYQVYASSPINEEFLKVLHSSTDYVQIGNEHTKSIVITTDKVYLSPLATNTLKRRAQFFKEIESEIDEITS
jgi:extracellular matrix regulatory protein B